MISKIICLMGDKNALRVISWDVRSRALSNLECIRTEKQGPSSTQYFWFGALFFSQNWTNFEKHWKMAVFQRFWLIFRVFWSLLKFDWKTAHQTKEFKFCNKFCFFSYECCPQTRDNSGVNKIFFISPCVDECP